MHKRRIDMLNNVLGQLNPDHYLHVCRQLTFELAEALGTLRDLKRKLLDEVGWMYCLITDFFEINLKNIDNSR